MEACIEGAIQENATQEVRDGLFFEWQRLRENIVSCMEKVKITENNLPTNIPEKE